MFSKLIKLSILFVLLLAGYNTASASFTISRPPTNNLGLVGHWTFDGGKVVNGVALDSSGNGYNANLNSIATSTFYSTGKIGQGFLFDGTNDYASTTRINNNEITVAGWFNKTGNDFGSNNSDSMFGAWDWNANTQLQEGFDLRPGMTPGGSCIGVAAGSGYLCSGWIVVSTNGTTKTQKTSYFGLSTISKNGTTTDEWFHIAGTYTQSDGNQRLYVNGVLRDTDLHVAGNTVVPLATTTTGACVMKMNIGYSCVNNGYFNGKLDDVRLYNRALSGGEIKSLYNQSLSKINKTPTNILTNGLVGHWTFDGADTNWTTNTVADKSGNGNTGTMTNMSTSTSPAIGKIGQALNFDGVNDAVIMGDVLDASSASMSVSAWVKLSALSLNQKIVYKAHSVSPWESWELHVNTSNEAVFQLVNTSATYFNAGTNPISANVWYNVVGVKDGNNLKIYLNGIDSSAWTDTVSGTVQNANSNLTFGLTDVSGTSPLSGRIDEVRIYSRALSASEIKMLYNMGR